MRKGVLLVLSSVSALALAGCEIDMGYEGDDLASANQAVEENPPITIDVEAQLEEEIEAAEEEASEIEIIVIGGEDPTFHEETGPSATSGSSEEELGEMYPTCESALDQCAQNCSCPDTKVGTNLCTYSDPGTPQCVHVSGYWYDEVECRCTYTGTFLGDAFPFPELCHSLAGSTFVIDTYGCDWN